MQPPMLLAVPNISEGRAQTTVGDIARALMGVREALGDARPVQAAGAPGPVRLLDIHSDADHHRSVFTLAGRPPALADALLDGARRALELVDVMDRARGDGSQRGQHPHVGTLDVVPIVYLASAARGAACAEALVVADRIGAELEVPVFLYGELTASGQAPGRSRAELRRGGIAGLAARMAGGQVPVAGEGAGVAALRPDFGPSRMHPSGGASLVAARPPLVAFNLQLASPATLQDARAIAGLIREGGEEGMPGVRAIGVGLAGHVAQVSMNLERPLEISLAMVIEAVARHADVRSAELVGLAPRAAFDGFPQDIPIPGFDPARHVLENAIGW